MRLQITKRVLLSTLLYTVTLLYSWESYGQFGWLRDTVASFFDTESLYEDLYLYNNSDDHSAPPPAEEIATTDHATSTLDEINNSLPTVNLDSVNAAVRDSILPIEDMQSNDLPRTDHSDGDDHRALPNSQSNNHQIDYSAEEIMADLRGCNTPPFLIPQQLILKINLGDTSETIYTNAEKMLAQFSNLQRLTLKINPDYTLEIISKIAEVLPSLTNLQCFNLLFDFTTNEEAIAILVTALATLPNLQQFTLRIHDPRHRVGCWDTSRDWDKPILTSTFANALAKLTNLRRLDLGHCNLTSDILAPVFQHLPRLQLLDLRHNSIVYPEAQTTDFVNALQNLTDLRHLNLGHNRLSSSTMIALATILPTFSNLRQLDLSHNAANARGIKTLASALANLPRLQQFNFNCGSVRGGLPTSSSFRAHGDAIVKHLAPALRNLTNLQQLNLANNYLCPDGIAAVANVLPRLTNLRQLCLSNNCIYSDETSPLNTALAHLPNLQQLNLSRNPMSVNNVAAFANILPHMTQLQLLNLSANGINIEGGLALANALLSLTTTNMQELNLMYNEIDHSNWQLLRAHKLSSKIILSLNDRYM